MNIVIKSFFTSIYFFLLLSFPAITSAANVSITDAKGIETNVEAFKSHRQENCGGVRYYLGVPTETDFFWDFIPIDTGEYIVRIPFSIIRQIEVEEKTDPENRFIKSYVYTVNLADNSILKGTVAKIKEFTGDSDLGKFKISIGGVRSIIFQHVHRTSFNASKKGNHSANLVLFEKSTMILDGATFVEENKNKNGCYTGEGYPSFIKFQTGESEYEISWDKIAEIVFVKTDEKYSYRKFFKLVTRKGSEYTGSASNIIGIEGVAKLGGYSLRVTVPLDSNSIKLVFKH